MNKDNLPVVYIGSKHFFTLNNDEYKLSWKIGEMNIDELTIVCLLVNSIGRTIDDINCVYNMLMTRHVHISLLITYNNSNRQDLFIIRRINNTKYRVSIDIEPKPQDIGYIVIHHG